MMGCLKCLQTLLPTTEEHSPRERRRFTFPFRERSAKTSVVKNDESTSATTPTNTPSTTPGVHFPKQRLMRQVQRGARQ